MAPPVQHVGILGGGQLGRMMAQAGHRLGLDITIVDPAGALSPAGQISTHAIAGSFHDAAVIRSLAQQVDVLTVEIEHINTKVLLELEREGKTIHPSPATLQLIQDKFRQKQFLQTHDIPVADFHPIEFLSDVPAIAQEFGFPFMLKSRCMAYDGNGNAVIRGPEDIEAAWTQLQGENGLLYAERWVPYVKELAVMIVKGRDHQDVRAYPLTETVQQANICHTVLAPAPVSSSIEAQALAMSLQAIGHLTGAGIFGVELFLTADGHVLLNEIAPRPHNSGHYTIEACETDQFEQHLRAVAGLPLGSCALRVGASMMLNVLGHASCDETLTYAPLSAALSVSGASIHRYGKTGPIRAGRKLAHVTVCAPTMADLQTRVASIDAQYVPEYVSTTTPAPMVGIIMGSDSDLPCMAAAAKVLEQFAVPYELTVVSAHRTPARMFEYAQSASKRGLRIIIAGAGGAAHLPGMVAALTPIPVIGVPVKTSTLNGEDSLLSIVQMPRGVPVATVAIGNATNAGLLAIRMLGLAETRYERQMAEFMQQQEAQVCVKVDTLQELGWQKYLLQM